MALREIRAWPTVVSPVNEFGDVHCRMLEISHQERKRKE